MAFLVCLTIALPLLIASSAIACDRCDHQSKVSFFSTDQPLQTGACGYGSLALGFNAGNVAAASPTIYKEGAGCGACFLMRCKDEQICSKQGTGIIVTDRNTDSKTEFVLSNKAFRGMAKPGMENQLLTLGIADVQYKRVPCMYEKSVNLGIRVEESSNKYYLAVKLLNQGGQTEIVGVDVALVSSTNWISMSRNGGQAVWTATPIPNGALQFRFTVINGYDRKLYWANRSVLPADWKTGVVYDSGLQISDIAQEACSPCDNSTTWN